MSETPGNTGKRAAAAEFAVLVPFLDRHGRRCVLLTERRADLPSFPGHVSFPGGAREPSDDSLEDTALRETHEEVGIPPEKVEVLEELEWFRTTLGHRVKPFVGRVRGGIEPEPNPLEVERLLYVPTDVLREDPFSVRGTFVDGGGARHEVYTMPFDGAEIWGLTARILRRFFVERRRGAGPEDILA